MTTQTIPDSSLREHLSKALSSTTSAFEVTTRTAARIVQMPALSSPQIPSLSDDIQEAKNHAQQFTSQVTPEIHQTFKKMTAFVTQFNQSFSSLTDGLSQWEAAGKPSQEFDNAIKSLNDMVTTSASEIQTLSTALNNYRQGGSDISRKLSADVQQANAQIQADQQQEAALQQTINSLNSKIAADRKRNSVFRWFGPLGWLVTEISDLITNERGIEEQYRKVVGERATVENDAGQLNCLLPQLNVFVQSTQLLLSGVLSVNQAWNVLHSDFEEVTQALSTTEKTPPPFVKAHLEYIHADFTTLLKELQELSQ